MSTDAERMVRALRFANYTRVSDPLIGLIVVLVSGDGQKRAPCWQCKERIVVGAVKCSHCGANQVWRRGESASA